MEDRYKATLLHRIKSRKNLDSLFFLLVANASTAVFIHELNYYDLSSYLTVPAIFTFICLSLLIPILRFRVWSCPKCDHSILASNPRLTLYNWFPRKCAKCDLNFEELLKAKPRIDVKGIVRLHFTIIGLIFLALYGAMLYGMVSTIDFYSKYVYALGALIAVVSATSLWALKTRCYHCFLPFQTKSVCSRCGKHPRDKQE